MNLKEEILSKIDNNSDKLTKARTIYVLLALYLEFSTKFQNTTPLEMGKMYFETFDITNIPSAQINCNIWANIYCDLLASVGIRSNIVDQGHKSVLFDIDGKIWCADATYGTYTDIARIKYGEKTTNFGVSFFQDMAATRTIVNVADPDNERVEEIDNGIPEYVERKASHKRNLRNIDIIKKSGLSLEEKLEVFFNRLPKLHQGYYEAKNYVYNLEDKLLTEEESLKVSAVEFKKTNGDLSVDIIQCINVADKDYYLLASNNQIVKTNLKNLYKLCLFYGFSLDGVLKGFKLPSKFIPGKVNLASKLLPLKLKLTKEIGSLNNMVSYSK